MSVSPLISTYSLTHFLPHMSLPVHLVWCGATGSSAPQASLFARSAHHPAYSPHCVCRTVSFRLVVPILVYKLYL